jgi:hypothetical protein
MKPVFFLYLKIGQFQNACTTMIEIPVKFIHVFQMDHVSFLSPSPGKWTMSFLLKTQYIVIEHFPSYLIHNLKEKDLFLEKKREGDLFLRRKNKKIWGQEKDRKKGRRKQQELDRWRWSRRAFHCRPRTERRFGGPAGPMNWSGTTHLCGPRMLRAAHGPRLSATTYMGPKAISVSDSNRQRQHASPSQKKGKKKKKKHAPPSHLTWWL